MHSKTKGHTLHHIISSACLNRKFGILTTFCKPHMHALRTYFFHSVSVPRVLLATYLAWLARVCLVFNTIKKKKKKNDRHVSFKKGVFGMTLNVTTDIVSKDNWYTGLSNKESGLPQLFKGNVFIIQQHQGANNAQNEYKYHAVFVRQRTG